jgi:outer membrane lipoprotein
LTAAQVLWGGVIIQTTNVSGGTEIEVLDYPLAGGQRPDVAKTARGRFIATTERYLETVDYAAGRQITLIGRITGVRNGKIGEADYRYAIVALDDIHLWPVATTTSAPRFTFGIGINIEK